MGGSHCNSIEVRNTISCILSSYIEFSFSAYDSFHVYHGVLDCYFHLVTHLFNLTSSIEANWYHLVL